MLNYLVSTYKEDVLKTPLEVCDSGSVRGKECLISPKSHGKGVFGGNQKEFSLVKTHSSRKKLLEGDKKSEKGSVEKNSLG